jgi:hypothetical protein
MVSDFRLEIGMSGAEVSDEEGVLVVVTRTAEVGLSEHAYAHRTSAHARLGEEKEVGDNLGRGSRSVNVALA